jgi:hypothetical protein
MKKRPLFYLLFLTLTIISCSTKKDKIIGTWSYSITTSKSAGPVTITVISTGQRKFSKTECENSSNLSIAGIGNDVIKCSDMLSKAKWNLTDNEEFISISETIESNADEKMKIGFNNAGYGGQSLTTLLELFKEQGKNGADLYKIIQLDEQNMILELQSNDEGNNKTITYRKIEN